MRVQLSIRAALTGRTARLVTAAGLGVILSGAFVATGAQAAPVPAPPGGGTPVKEYLANVVFNGSDRADATHKTIPVLVHQLNGAWAYCVDWKDSVRDGSLYHEATSDEKVTPPQYEAVTAILAHGLGTYTAQEVVAAAGITDLHGISGAALDNVVFTGTQAAVWHTAFPEEFTLRVPASVDDPQVQELGKNFENYQAVAIGAWDAKKWFTETKLIESIYKYLLGKFGTPTLTIAPATGNGSVGGKVGPFTVDAHDVASVDVKVSTGGALVDKDGKPVTTVKAGSQFWVDCKAEGTVTVTATGKSKVVTVKLWTGTYTPYPEKGEKGDNAIGVTRRKPKKAEPLQTMATVVVTEKDVTANATATCNAAPTTPSLPVTGAPVIGTIAAGVVLLLVGGGLFLVRRRRTRFTA